MKNKKDGQILVILVLVLLVLAIIVMSIISVVTKDVEERVGSSQYAVSYNQSEEELMKIISKYSDVSISLETLLNEGCSGANFEYECVFDKEDTITTLKISDTQVVSDFELEKDETLKLKLNSTYRGDLDIRWTGDFAIEMTLEYRDANNEYKTIKDIYDNKSILSQSGLSSSDHLMNYSIVDANSNHIIVNINSITGLTADDKPIFFKIKALSKDFETTLISVSGDSTFPRQVRRFEAATMFKTNTKSSMPVLISQVPLAGRQPELLDYVLLTPNEISK